MIRLNRTTEYGLVALRHMTRKRQLDPGSVTSAREISDCYGLPFEITAKTLQRLKDTGLIQSEQGARGGYTLNADLNKVSLAEFLRLLQGKRSLVVCSPAKPGERRACEYQDKCEIRGLMASLNNRVAGFLSGIQLAELFEGAQRSRAEEVR
jgi:Rrf2 family protein